MTSTIRRRGPDLSGDTVHTVLTVGLPFFSWGLLWWAVAAGAFATGGPRPSAVPGRLFVDLLTGAYRCLGWWEWGAPLTVLAVQVAAYTVAVQTVRRLGHHPRAHIDRSATRISGRADVRRMSWSAVAVGARRLNQPLRPPGILLGTSVRGGQPVFAPWEANHVDIWGPRTGKTTMRVIPTVMSAPGSVVVTSNKLDVLEVTRTARARRGPVWVYDPQDMTGRPQDWWWNILHMVGRDPSSALQVATLFSAMIRKPHTRSDGLFEPAAEGLVAALLLAASVGGHPVTHVYRWCGLSSPRTSPRAASSSWPSSSRGRRA